MASITAWRPFLDYWGNYCKDTFGEAMGLVALYVKFSEGLLHSLYYETDVGSIPHGIQFDTSASKPQFVDSNNWNCSIHGCYWCGDDSTDLLGICCCKDCIFYLHDWCIERVEFFTQRQFCRLPGCDNIHGLNSLYCTLAHRGKFDAAFPQFVDHKKLRQSVIRNGPCWYVSQILSNSFTVNQSVVPPNFGHATSPDGTTGENSSSMKDNKSLSNLEFPDQFRDMLIYNTDVGVIPRGRIIQQYLGSKFYESPNWLAVIKGCYSCGNRNVGKFYDEMFCSERCQLVFYEWCRKKIERETSTTFCQLPGCPKYASEGFDCCNKEHSIIIQHKYTDCKNMDIKRLICTPPKWYNRSLTPFESIPPTNQHSQVFPKTQFSPSHPPIQQSTQVVPPQFQYSGPHFLFSQQLTEFLYYNTDVGPIPREIQTFMPPAPLNLANQQNWLSAITQCYWCCASRLMVQGITCSDKCFFLLNEWLHNKFTNFSNIRLCRVLGCSYFASQGFQCCNREHSVKFESSFKKYFSLLKETEFNLGPAWYNDYSRILINFYHREDPFYEFSNFYPCTNLYMSNINWKTSEHYFQASKFAGTPYFRYVSTCPAPRDAFKFARERAVQSWIRPNWHNVKLNVMYNVLVHKFQQDRGLLNILLRTGNAKIVEHTKNDKFWGDGGDGSGDNMLGTLLMRARDHLREIHPNMAPKPNQQNIPISNYIPCNHQNQSVNPATFSPSNTSPTHNTVRPSKPTMHSSDYHPPNSEDTKRSVTNESNKTTDPSTPIVEPPNIQQPDSSTEKQEPGSTSELKPPTDSGQIQSPKTLIITLGETKRELPVDYKCPFNIPSSPFNDTEQITYNDSEPSSSQDLGSSSNFSFNLAQVTAELQEQSVDSSSEHFSLSNPFHPSFENIPVDPREYRPSENTEEIVEPHYMTNQFDPPTSSSCLIDQPMTADCVNKLDTQREDLPMEEDPSLTQGGFHFPNPCNENTISVQNMTLPSHLHSPNPKEEYNGSPTEEDEAMTS